MDYASRAYLDRYVNELPKTRISVFGQEHRVEKFTSRHDIGTRFKQTEDGLQVSVKRAQRLYNNRRWPNAVVLRLENVEFAKLVVQ